MQTTRIILLENDFARAVRIAANADANRNTIHESARNDLNGKSVSESFRALSGILMKTHPLLRRVVRTIGRRFDVVWSQVQGDSKAFQLIYQVFQLSYEPVSQAQGFVSGSALKPT